jgi:hypothetical protein
MRPYPKKPFTKKGWWSGSKKKKKNQKRKRKMEKIIYSTNFQR